MGFSVIGASCIKRWSSSPSYSTIGVYNYRYIYEPKICKYIFENIIRSVKRYKYTCVIIFFCKVIECISLKLNGWINRRFFTNLSFFPFPLCSSSSFSETKLFFLIMPDFSSFNLVKRKPLLWLKIVGNLVGWAKMSK